MKQEAQGHAPASRKTTFPKAAIAVGGSLLRVRRAYSPMATRAATHRGSITRFSNGSRRRLIDFLASINRSQVRHLPLFVTLTYPMAFPQDRATYKRQLDTWLKRLKREYPAATAVWKLEFQQRGAPHYHLLLFGVRFIPREWVARTWFEIVASNDTRHLDAGTEVKRVRSWRGVMFYASKYLAKVEDKEPPHDPGRFWGVFCRAAFPVDVIEFTLTFRQYWHALRLWRRARRHPLCHNIPLARNGQGFKVYRSDQQQSTWLTAILNYV